MRRWIVLTAFLLTNMIGHAVFGEEYPSKPIRIVTTEPGGSADFVARLSAGAMAGSFGQPVVVDNRPGVTSVEIVMKAQPDGYTLLLNGGNIWILPFLRSNVNFNVERDLAPITLLTSSPNVVVVHPSLGVKSVTELIALAKAQPGSLNYASGVTGSANHLGAELFKAMAAVNIVRVSYKATGFAFTDLIAGRVQVMFPTAASVTPYLKSGRLKAVAVTSARPSMLFPDLPTVASALPGYEAGSMQGLWAPNKMPIALSKRLNQQFERVVGQAEVKEQLLGSGLEAAPSSPQQFANVIRADVARMSKLIKDAGIREE